MAQISSISLVIILEYLLVIKNCQLFKAEINLKVKEAGEHFRIEQAQTFINIYQIEMVIMVKALEFNQKNKVMAFMAIEALALFRFSFCS